MKDMNEIVGEIVSKIKPTTKIEALAKHLGVNLDDAEKLIDDGDYLVLTDSEADERCLEYIRDSVWAFNASFLASHSKVADEEVFKILQEKCEGGNDAITRLIDDFDHFVKDAVSSDGRGHFMSSYDGEENEEGEFFIYRMN